MSSRNALIVFFKVPQAGKVKTRLSPFFSPEDATRLYAYFIEDTFEKVCATSVQVFGFVSGAIDEQSELWEFLSARRVQVVEQVGRDLGERMSRAFRFCFEQGYKRVCIIGTDSPDMPLSIIERAFEVLETNAPTVAIAGADDGGYVLLGMNRYFPEAFQHVPYSTSETYAATLAQLSNINANLIELEKWYDIDTPDDLKRLAQTSLRSHAPRTVNFLNHLFNSRINMKLTIGVTEYLRKALPPYETKTDEYIAWLKSGEAFGYDIECVRLPYSSSSFEALKAQNLDALSHLDAIVFSGGHDVEPSLFGVQLSREALNELNVQNSIIERDEMELLLARKSIEQGLPVLGICRGLQLVNVAMGGTLILDIEKQKGIHGHEAKGPEESGYHTITLEPNSKLGKMIGATKGEVSTRHHQAADKVGEGLRIVGHSNDGIIEAMESIDDRPIFLVQWHPERMWLEKRDNAFSETLLKNFLAFVAQRKHATTSASA
ncbi:MAG: TIGR04282 family arsenosugar biosynthesis glycosyltransferase [Chloroherpetonaceae bacterium]